MISNHSQSLQMMRPRYTETVTHNPKVQADQTVCIEIFSEWPREYLFRQTRAERAAPVVGVEFLQLRLVVAAAQ